MGRKWRNACDASYKPTMGYSWRVDETYVKVKEKWTCLYRVMDKHSNTIDFYPSSTLNKKAAKRFLDKALKSIKPWAHPQTINTDKAPTFGLTIEELKKEGIYSTPTDEISKQHY